MNPMFSYDDDEEEEDVPAKIAAGAAPSGALAELSARLSAAEEQVAELFAAIKHDFQQIAEQLAHAAPSASPAQPSGSEASQAAAAMATAARRAEPGPSNGGVDLEALVFGPELSGDGSLEAARRELISDMLGGDAAAMSLSGAILLFRGATAERMPQLLKDIGEAWYAWRRHAPEGHDPLRDQLCRFLERKCAEAGAPNTIELVHVGDRYDSKRHHAKQPGVEVAEIAGWVVLRSNGTVYTKAAVTVK